MRKLFLCVTLMFSLLLCSVTAFADSLPPLIPFDTFFGDNFVKPLPEIPPPASNDTPTDEILPPASSDVPTDELLPPASIDVPTDELLPPASSDVPTDDVLPPASSDVLPDEVLPPASSDVPTDELLPPASSDTPTDEILPPASSDVPPDTVFASSAEVAEIINELKILNNILGILVYGLIPLTFAIACIIFSVRWFCRTFIPSV